MRKLLTIAALISSVTMAVISAYDKNIGASVAWIIVVMHNVGDLLEETNSTPTQP